MSRSAFFLEPMPPFRLDLTVWALRRRPDNIVDRWDGQTYRRILFFPTGPAEVAITQTGPSETPRLCVTVGEVTLNSEVKEVVRMDLERLLAFRTNIADFYPLASLDASLGPLAQRFRGMKPPRFLTVFESVITAIAGQEVTRNVGVLLVNRLTKIYGAAVHQGDTAIYAFPRAEELDGLHPSDLRQLGFSRQKGLAIIELAKSITSKGLDLESLVELPDEEAIESLCGLRGVGRWSAEYVLLRGLGRINIFPGDDVGARKNLERWLKLVKPLDYVSVHCILKRWHPYGGLVLLPPVVGQVGGGRIPDGRNIASIERWLSTKRNKEYIGEHIDETRIQIWGSCRVELGSRTCSRNDKKEGHHHYQV